MSPVSPHALARGSSLHQGRFEVRSFVGHGSFGICYRAVDRTLGRDVAIKEFYPQGCARQGARVVPGPPLQPQEFVQGRDDFVREAEVLARFNHPGIVSILDIFSENDTAYMVMEWLDGTTLEGLVERAGGLLSEEDAVHHVERLGEALDILHRDSIIHRDIKPDNVVHTDDGRTVLIDFGIARSFGSRTVALEALGSPGFAPPEQYRARARYGPWTDIYALGATLFFMVSGEVPPSALDREQGTLLGDLQRLRARAQANPLQAHVVEAVHWALELNAGARPQSVQAFLGALSGRRAARRPTTPLPLQGAGALRPLKFARGQASDLAAVADLCDRYPDEAIDYLAGGILGGWLGANGEAVLARRAGELSSQCRRATAKEKRRSLELLVRDIAREAGVPFEPLVVPSVPVVSVTGVPLGASAESTLTVGSTPGRHAWGDVDLVPALPGVSITPTFDTRLQPEVKIGVHAGACPPGTHRASIVLQEAETGATVRLPFDVTVEPLVITVEPRSLDFGRVAFATTLRKEIRIGAEPPGGSLEGRIAIDPPCPALEVPARAHGNPCRIPVVLDTATLGAGSRYRGVLALETLQGRLEVPVAFAVVLNLWRLLLLVACGAGLGALAGGAGRQAIGLCGAVCNNRPTGLLLAYDGSLAPQGYLMLIFLAILAASVHGIRSRGLPGSTAPGRSRGVADIGCMLVVVVIGSIIYVIGMLLVLVWYVIVYLFQGIGIGGVGCVMLGDYLSVGLLGSTTCDPATGWALLGALAGGSGGLAMGIREVNRRREARATIHLLLALLVALLLRAAVLVSGDPGEAACPSAVVSATPSVAAASPATRAKPSPRPVARPSPPRPTAWRTGHAPHRRGGRR